MCVSVGDDGVAADVAATPLFVVPSTPRRTSTRRGLAWLVSLGLTTAAFADSPWLYGIHWWGHGENQPVDDAPCALLDCPAYGGWSVETVVTHSDYHWRPAFFTGLYQNLYATRNVSIITRLDYKWGETVPSPTSPGADEWPASCAGAVNTLGPYCHIWQIGNEANVTSEAANWPQSRIYPAQYAEVYRNVRAAIHATANPSPAGPHIVLIAPPSPGAAGGLRWMSGTDWLAQVLDAIPDEEVDGVAIHSYGGTVAGFRDSYSAFLALLTSRSLHHVPVYLTEWNRVATPGSDASEAAAAAFCRDAFADVHNWNQTPGNHNIICLAWFVYDANQQAGGFWNSRSIEYWRTDGNPAGDSGDLYTAFHQAVQQRYPAGAVGNPGYIAGLNIAPGSVAISADSLSGPGHEPDLSIDGRLDTWWTSASTAGDHWLHFDLGLPAPVRGFKVWHASAGGDTPSHNTRAILIESAPTAAGPWTLEHAGDNTAQESVSSFEYASPKELRHVRVRITDPGEDGIARVAEVEVLANAVMTEATPAGTNVAPASTQAVASSEFGPDWGADKAIDGIISAGSKWTSADTPPPHSLSLDLGTTVAVSGFILRQPSGTGELSSFNAARFSFQSARSMNGPWFTESVGANTGSADSDARSFVAPKSLRFVRLLIDDPGSDNYARVPEFEVWSAADPTANFSAVPTRGRVPLQVQFTDLSIGNINVWSWDFGDGASSDARNPSHTYTDPGAYTVRQAVQGPNGSDSEIKLDYVIVEAVPADFDGDGDVDQDDFGYFQTCLGDSGIPQDDPECHAAKLDGDNDVDQHDLAIFVACLSGANVLVDPECGD